jgi:hypothetical protein
MGRTETLADAVMGQMKGEQPAEEKPKAHKTTPRKPVATKTASAAKKAGPAKAAVARPASPREEGQLADMAADPVVFIKLAKRPAQGTGEAPLNVNLPAEDVTWLREFCAREGLAQKEIIRVFVQALRADEETYA